MANLQLQNLGKVYSNGVKALDAFNLDVADGELVAVVGPSGSGKSTLARLIAGLEVVSSGTILIDGRSVNEVSPRDRDVAMVFQNPALYPHLNVAENLGFSLRARGVSRLELTQKVAETAELLGIANLLRRRPATLSGGQRQRVAIGRAIARRPQVLLLDEPFTALDARLRSAIRADLVELQRQLNLTTILITHDQSEALAVGHRIAVLGAGTLRQVGTSAEVYSRPNSRFVAQFLGYPPINILKCVVEESETGRWLHVAGVRLPLPSTLAIPRSPLEIGLRAEHIQALPLGESDFTGIVHRFEPVGHEVLVTIAITGGLLTIRLPGQSSCVVGDRLGLVFDLGSAVWFS